MTTRTHTLVQLTDTHLVADGLLYDVVDPAANVQRALDAVASRVESLDALLLTGDLANVGEPGAYRRLREIVDTAAAQLGVPVFYGMGNHDERVAFRAELLDGQPAPAGTQAGPGSLDDPAAPVDYTVELDGLRLVFVDSTTPGHHHGSLTDDQVDWLGDVLATPAPAGTLLTIHHPPFAWSEEGPEAEFTASASFHDMSGLARAISGRDVTMILAGHYHEPLAGRLGGVPVWAGPATAMAHEISSANDLFRIVPSSGFSVIDVYEDGTAVARAVNCLERPVLFEMSMEELKAHIVQAVH